MGKYIADLTEPFETVGELKCKISVKFQLISRNFSYTLQENLK